MGCVVERAHFNLQIELPLLFLLVLGLLTGRDALAQSNSGEVLANDLRRNVVYVISRWADGSQHTGFGFVVGERAGLLYIVTADHVVRDSNQTSATPGVFFYQDRGKEYQGDVLATHLMRPAGDLAVIRVPPPPGFSWQPKARSGVPAARGSDVWFIGRLGDWYVPVKPGAISSVEPNRTIRFEGLTILEGTSGAPLVSNAGILGMIVVDTGVLGEATPLDVIERAFQEWNYPWQLANYSVQPAVSPPPPPPPPPDSNWTSRYNTRDNRDLWLGDLPLPGGIVGTRNVDIKECAQRCTDNPNCVAFSYDRWNRACYPKNKVVGSLLDPHSMIAVKKPGELPSVSQKTPDIETLRDRRMHGDISSTKKSTDFSACRSACEENLQCVAFNFLKRPAREDNCQMFKFSDGYERDPSGDAGFKHQTP